MGEFGHLLLITSFVASLVIIIANYLSIRIEKDTPGLYYNLAKVFGILHIVGVVGALSVLLYLFATHQYQFEYVYGHSSVDMPRKYLLVALWGGQEGSMFLWAFWQAVFSLFFLFKKSKLSRGVMLFTGVIQAFTTAMILGITFPEISIPFISESIGPFKMGKSPFALIKDTNPDFGPIWSKIPNYQDFDPFFDNGKGLTLSLQNYWMVIHPPTLFAGFALTLIPFSYALSALFNKDFKSWAGPALKWGAFGMGILGIGILMGGAWAYESLNFGGFWAWDPVENASLIPWILLVIAVHLTLIYKKRGKSLYSALLFTLLAYIFVIYSSFLTRSGVLGDTSVHSFTGEGMAEELIFMMHLVTALCIYMLIQSRKWRKLFVFTLAAYSLAYFLVPDEDYSLLFFILGFLIITIFVVVPYLKYFPKDGEDEAMSKEFWIFIGNVVMGIAGLQIIIATSIPLINQIFDSEINLFDPEARNEFYNSKQILFSIFITLALGTTQFIKYKNDKLSRVIKQLGLSFALSFVFTLLFFFLVDFHLNSTDIPLLILLFTSLFAVFANLDYFFRIIKNKKTYLGPAVAHVGFGLILVGAVVSNGKQKVISANSSSYMTRLLGESFSDSKDIAMLKGDTIPMGPYMVSYVGERIEDKQNYYFDIKYFDKIANTYSAGDTVRFKGMVYVAKEAHEASPSLMADIDANRWAPMPSASYLAQKEWTPYKAGKFLFENNPRVLLDLKNFKDNMPEPGTKHYWNKDVFTHVKYGDLTPRKVKEVQNAELGEGYMTGYDIPFKTSGDTSITSSEIFVLKGVRAATADEKRSFSLFETDSVAIYDFNAFEIKDVNYQFPEEFGLYLAYRGEDVVMQGEAYASEDLNFRVFLKEVKIDIPEGEEDEHAGHDHSDPNHVHEETSSDLSQSSASHSEEHTVLDTAKINRARRALEIAQKKLNEKRKAQYEKAFVYYEPKEYIVMQAIVFPAINILWIGCVLMGLGSIIAGITRIRSVRD